EDNDKVIDNLLRLVNAPTDRLIAKTVSERFLFRLYKLLVERIETEKCTYFLNGLRGACQRFVEEDDLSSDTRSQYNLSVLCDNLGDVLLRQGNLAGAVENYRTALAIRNRLHQAAPNNVFWQVMLARSHVSIGNILERQGNLSGAMENYRTSLLIRNRIVEL